MRIFGRWDRSTIISFYSFGFDLLRLPSKKGPWRPYQGFEYSDELEVVMYRTQRALDNFFSGVFLESKVSIGPSREDVDGLKRRCNYFVSQLSFVVGQVGY